MNSSEWLDEHKFLHDEVKHEWTRTLNVFGNFKDVDKETKEVSFSKRTIQQLRITVKCLDNDEANGWIAKMEVRNGYDLDRKELQPWVIAENKKSALCDTPQEAIALASNSLGDLLCDCLKQVAKLASKNLTLTWEYGDNQ